MFHTRFDNNVNGYGGMMRGIVIFFIMIVLILSAGFALAQQFKSGTEPDGFRGIPWGTELSTITGMKFIATREIGGTLPESLWDFERGAFKKQINVDVYERLGDDSRLYGAAVKATRYGFWKGKFCEVTIIVMGHDNWKTLEDAVFEQFGKGTKIIFPTVKLGDEQPEWYNWIGTVAEMELIHLPEFQSGKFWIGSNVVRDKAFTEASE